MKRHIVKAPAKINIGLNIVSKRNDGFHNLETLFYPLHDLYDELIFEESNNFEFNSDLSFDNIIVKTVHLLETYTKRKINIKITLNKNIPIGAGLGGGSSDAAAVLTTINEIYNLGLTEQELKKLALEIGSDVPFFIKGKPAIGKSRGEQLTIINFQIDNLILLVNPGIHISTKEAFSGIVPKPSKFDYNNINNIPLKKYRENIINDFEKSIFMKHPEIEKIKNALYSSGAIFALMSGSGSTLYGIFDKIEDVRMAIELFPKSYFTFVSNSFY